MTSRSFGLVVVVLAVAACEKPNLEATEGGYGRRPVARDSATPASATPAPASPATSAETAAPAAADTALP